MDKETYNKASEKLQEILEESYELARHENSGISLSGAEINNLAYDLKKFMDRHVKPSVHWVEFYRICWTY